MTDASDGQTGLLGQLADDRDLLVAMAMAMGLGLFLFGVTRDPMIALSAFFLAAVGAILLST